MSLGTSGYNLFWGCLLRPDMHQGSARCTGSDALLLPPDALDARGAYRAPPQLQVRSVLFMVICIVYNAMQHLALEHASSRVFVNALTLFLSLLL